MNDNRNIDYVTKYKKLWMYFLLSDTLSKLFVLKYFYIPWGPSLVPLLLVLIYIISFLHRNYSYFCI